MKLKKKKRLYSFCIFGYFLFLLTYKKCIFLWIMNWRELKPKSLFIFHVLKLVFSSGYNILKNKWKLELQLLENALCKLLIFDLSDQQLWNFKPIHLLPHIHLFFLFSLLLDSLPLLLAYSFLFIGKHGLMEPWSAAWDCIFSSRGGRF